MKTTHFGELFNEDIFILLDGIQFPFQHIQKLQCNIETNFTTTQIEDERDVKTEK